MKERANRILGVGKKKGILHVKEILMYGICA